jgi:hypothetical protein
MSIEAAHAGVHLGFSVTLLTLGSLLLLIRLSYFDDSLMKRSTKFSEQVYLSLCLCLSLSLFLKSH